MKNHIATTTVFLNKKNIFDDQIRQEYLNYEIRTFSIQFSVSDDKKGHEEMNNLDSKMKILKENLTTNNEGNQNYRKCKRDLN